MKRRHFSAKRFIAILQDQEADQKMVDMRYRPGISDVTFYIWTAS